MSAEFDSSDFMRHLAANEAAVVANATMAIQDATDDLLRIARDIAPIDSTDLRRSGATHLFTEPNKYIGEVAFGVTKGNFNYAYKIHETEYRFGIGTAMAAAAGGTDGYHVGNKFLQRPLEGESAKYMTWLTEAILRGLS